MGRNAQAGTSQEAHEPCCSPEQQCLIVAHAANELLHTNMTKYHH